MRISGGIAAALCVTAMLSARGAMANGRFPASTQVVFSPSDPDRIVVRATYGLLLSGDNGATWRWLCETALGVPSVSVEDPSVALTGGDALVVGLAEGLEVSQDSSGGAANDLGCNIACVDGPLAGLSIVDLTVRPGATHTVLALSSSYVFGDGGGATASLDNRVWQSSDDGAHWSQLGTALDPTVTVTTLDVAASDPARLYISGTRGFGALRTASLFVSTDAGQTWTERSLPFDPTTEVAVFIGAVDPLDADRVYIRSSGVSRLRVTRDAGRTFQIPLTLTGQMLGFAVTVDGAEVYAGSIEDGLFVAAAPDNADGGFAFRKISSLHVQCLATRAGEVWACSDDASGFSVGVSSGDGGPFAPRLRQGGLAGPIACAQAAQGPFACDADSGASQCAGAAFEALCATLGGCGVDADLGQASGTPRLALDASASPLTPDASASAVMRTSFSSCGCSAAPGDGSSEIGAVGALMAVAARRKRRTRD